MTRNPGRNLPKSLSSLSANHLQQYDDFNAATKSMISMTTKQQQYQKPNSETLERGRKKRFRYFVASLGLTVAAVNCYAQATFCIAIVEMVLPADYVFRDESGSQTIKVVVPSLPPLTSIGNSSTTGPRDNIINDHQAHIEVLESLSCPVEYKYRDYYDEWRFPNVSGSSSTPSLANLLTKATSPVAAGSNSHLLDISNRFDWDASRQGLLLGAFAMGMAPLQVLGGRLAEIYGAKWVLMAGCVGTALTNLTIPVLAHFSYSLLVLNRILMGVAQAGMEPGLMCLMAQWLAPAETGFFISMLLFALCIGFFLGSLLSSFLLTIGLGWALTYYVTGGLNLLVSLVWFVYASKGPEESGLISEEELAYIRHEQHQERAKAMWQKANNDLSQTRSTIPANQRDIPLSETNNTYDSQQQAPWLNILTTPSVWAFIICKISVRWCADVLTIELPTYLANVLHLSIKLNGILNSLSSAFFAIFSFTTGYFVNELLKRTHEGVASEQERRNNKQFIATTTTTTTHVTANAIETGRTGLMSKTTLRKLFQSVASFGSAIAIFLMTRYDCNIQLSMGMMFVLSACLMMGTGGELQIPYDMTSRYPGTLHGMACTLSVSGWLAPPLIGLILGDQPSSRHRWSIVWYLTASINLIGGLVFVLFADASPRNFDKRAPSKKGKPAKVPQQQRRLRNGNIITSNGTETIPVADNNGQQSQAGPLMGAGSTCSVSGRGRSRSSGRSTSIGGFGPAGSAAQTKVRCLVSSAPRPSPQTPTTTFDGAELLRIRQLEGSSLLLSSSSSLAGGQQDSLLAADVMFPYQPAKTGARKTRIATWLAWLSADTRQPHTGGHLAGASSSQRRRHLNGRPRFVCQAEEGQFFGGPTDVSSCSKIITRL